MHLRTWVAAGALLVALNVSVSDASASEPIGKKSIWETNETSFPESYAAGKALKCSKRSANIVIKGTLLSFPTTLVATGLECLNARLFNFKTSQNNAIGEGALRFTGLTVTEPAGCGIASTLTTESFITSVYMDSEAVGRTYWKFFSPTKFASIKITGCAIEGSYPLTGNTFGEEIDLTGEQTSNHPLKFNLTTNAFGELVLGNKPATITGESNNELVSAEGFRSTEK